MIRYRDIYALALSAYHPISISVSGLKLKPGTCLCIYIYYARPA